MFVKALLCLLFATVALAAESYDGYKIYDVNALDETQKEVLFRLYENKDYDFFTLPRMLGSPARVMVKPEMQAEFESLVSSYGMEMSVVNSNVAESVANERMENLMQRTSERGITFTKFYRFSEINNYLSSLAKQYPSRVKIQTIGRSYEGRELNTITISNGDGKTNKKVILLDAGIHAREWIAPAGALYVIQQLVENYQQNADLLSTYDWVVLPVVNPDGYEYSHVSSRMWRKTRKPVTNTCYGTDGNRNFDFHWGEVGASAMSCADTFRGQTAFSEPETQVLRNLMRSLSGRAKMYLTLHSYGNYLLYPWGYTSALPNNWRDIDDIAQAGASAIRSATGTRYTVGSSTNVLYAAAGGSDDYALAMANIPISITMELPAGGSGFDPKPSQIEPFVSETWIGIRAMARRVISKY